METLPTLSTLATYDDLRRCVRVLTDGTAEEEFLRVLQLQENFRKEYSAAVKEAQRLQKELDASLQNMADLESKLFLARRLLESEGRARRDAEQERDMMEKKIQAVADLLQHEQNIRDETRDKLAFFNTASRKRKSMNPLLEERYCNDINSTGSLLSDFSLTQSEDDFIDLNYSKGKWKKHRPSQPKSARQSTNTKRTRASAMGTAAGAGNTEEDADSLSPPAKVTPQTRRSSTHRSAAKNLSQHKAMQLNDGLKDQDDGDVSMEKISAITTVTIPKDRNGPIRSEHSIQSTPVKSSEIKYLQKQNSPETAAPMSSRRSVRLALNEENVATPKLIEHTKKSTPVCKSNTGTPTQYRSNVMRSHNFTTKTFIRAETCMHCQKKIRFGSIGLRCRDCPVRCHTDCRVLLTMSCVPQTNTPTMKGPMGYVSDYAPACSPMVPALIVHCVHEIESRGLNEMGIYRISGSEREVKSLKERFLRGKGTPYLGNIDIHVICCCLKDFLRSLREPLIPLNSWKDFCNAVQNSVIESEVLTDVKKAFEMMPPANRDTLAFLILHFQRVAESTDARMPRDNLARIFGPTIVGYSSPDPDQHALYTEVHTQFSVMQNLMKVPGEYWSQYVVLDSEKENGQELHNAGSATPSRKQTQKEMAVAMYATPFKGTYKKSKFYGTPDKVTLSCKKF